MKPLSPQEIAREQHKILTWTQRQIRALKAENARLRGELEKEGDKK